MNEMYLFKNRYMSFRMDNNRKESVMRKLFLLVCILSMLAWAGTAIAADIGSNYHITGCENGELLVPVVYMWERSYSHMVGKLSGTSKSDKCQGAIVKILDTKTASGRLRYKVKSIVNGKVGWVTHFFIGREVKGGN